MSNPSSVAGRTVIVGGGVHGAIYAATHYAVTGNRAMVIERQASPGGVFGRLCPFRLNSVNDASRESVQSGPSRIRPRSESDDLNYFPNAPVPQISRRAQGHEYPASTDVRNMICDTLYETAEVYADCSLFAFDSDGDCYIDGNMIGNAERIIWAAGLRMTASFPTSKSILTAEQFLADPTRLSWARQNVAIVGGGDTAATVAEVATGQGMTQLGSALPNSIAWYGGTRMPTHKMAWAEKIHARYMGLARHFPQLGDISILRDEDGDEYPTANMLGGESYIRPYAELGEIRDLGNKAMVNGRLYDQVIDATGFRPVRPTPGSFAPFLANGRAIAERDENYGKVFVVGAACENLPAYGPVTSRFGASRKAIFALAPATAELAALNV